MVTSNDKVVHKWFQGGPRFWTQDESWAQAGMVTGILPNQFQGGDSIAKLDARWSQGGA